MIRPRVVIDTTPIDGWIEFVENLTDLVMEVQRETFNEIQPLLLDELQFYPQEAVHPFEFATPASRRYYFWAVREGIIPTNGHRYVRSGRFKNSWEITLEFTGSTWEFVITNRFSATRYIVGSFDDNLDERVPGHITTGWQRIIHIVRRSQNAYIMTFTERFREFVDRTQASFITRIIST